MTADPSHVLITGASGGLGAALAWAYAAPGVHLSLGGRRAEALEALAAKVRARGATVDLGFVDVTDRAGMADWIAAADAARPLDLVIANAGISAGTGGTGGSAADLEPEALTRHLFDVNLAGVVNTVLPALACLRPRGRGQIALMASLAGYRGQPGAPAYCASKAAVKVWGEGLRAQLADSGVVVSVICPGFVRTPMTDANGFVMPFLMDADKAAACIRAGLARGRGRIAFPWPMAALAWLVATLPDPLAHALTRRGPRKAAPGTEDHEPFPPEPPQRGHS